MSDIFDVSFFDSYLKMDRTKVKQTKHNTEFKAMQLDEFRQLLKEPVQSASEVDDSY